MLNQLRCLEELVLLLVSSGSCAHPEARNRVSPTSISWMEGQGEVVPQRKAGGVNAGHAKAVDILHCPLSPDMKLFFFLTGLGRLGHGCDAVLLCVWPGNRVGVSRLLSVAGWPPGIDS